ncbi:hypothetical protein G3I71_44270 [Streptomyces sp. SID12501]|uniref:Uncharacterized protein n=2 Tax=Streptomyces sp. SID12501 TaxID=2706042 RepID=A0A6B3C733_9ACTN|nr:hypothetical protein [Streptomyces sp. SID12501]
MNQLRRQALAAREQDDVPGREALVAEWQRRLAELLEDNPELTDHLDLVLREVLSPSLRRAEPGDVYQQVNVSRESPTFAVQRGDLHYYEGNSAREGSREGNSSRESRDPGSAG